MDYKCFINEFYNLFCNSENKFVGSIEQARLIVQTNLNKFIPEKYIKLAFQKFKEYNLIYNTGNKEYISRVIGTKEFAGTNQCVYFKNTEIEDVQSVLDIIYPYFKEFNIDKSIAVTEEDIKLFYSYDKAILNKLFEYNSYEFGRDKRYYETLDYYSDIPRIKIKKYLKILESDQLIFSEIYKLLKDMLKEDIIIEYKLYNINDELLGVFRCNCLVDDGLRNSGDYGGFNITTSSITFIDKGFNVTEVKEDSIYEKENDNIKKKIESPLIYYTRKSETKICIKDRVDNRILNQKDRLKVDVILTKNNNYIVRCSNKGYTYLDIMIPQSYSESLQQILCTYKRNVMKM